jgi:hypothetical protein
MKESSAILDAKHQHRRASPSKNARKGSSMLDFDGISPMITHNKAGCINPVKEAVRTAEKRDPQKLHAFFPAARK